MTKRAGVTKAMLNRVLDTLEQRGKVVGDVLVRPDGSLSLGLTTGEQINVTSAQTAEDEWDKALGLR